MNTIVEHGLKGHLGMGAALQELRCLLAVAAGHSSKEAARELGVAPGTIDKRLLALTTKLGVRRRAELVATAFRRGIIAPACIFLSALIALQHTPSTVIRRPEPGRRAELRLSVRRVEESANRLVVA
ncbi:response regulator transcription factor [Pseudomonas sp. UBA6323]|uniref:response regulator transcription factor n=1 Tax=Pseudomonas sp. UBA6323 TaxID=1947329 RepID=UPI0025CF49B0|nr:helix-turn-helix transcriptional regulator [Pseudomonas sp. UBA6323]